MYVKPTDVIGVIMKMFHLSIRSKWHATCTTLMSNLNPWTSFTDVNVCLAPRGYSYMYSLETEHCPRACCTRNAFKCQNVCTSHETMSVQCEYAGGLGMWPVKTQQAGVMMHPVTPWLSLFYLENTSHLPPNPLTALLTQMCHQLHAESEECCLKCSPCTQANVLCPSPCLHHRSLNVMSLRRICF